MVRYRFIASLRFLAFLLLTALCAWPSHSPAQTIEVKQKVILDTDIGDDIDDAFALALALKSPELNILQINSDFGDTPLRARLVERFLQSVNRTDIPVAVGVKTKAPNGLTQSRYAELGPPAVNTDAVTSTLDLIRKYPNQITLIAIGPYINVGAMIDRDPDTFRKLKRVIVMGGSIYRGYQEQGNANYGAQAGPMPEWNVLQSVSQTRKLLAAGVPVFMMPLDATQLKLDEVKRQLIFAHGSPVTDQLTLLYHQWGNVTPTLFDPMTIAFAVHPDLCPVTPMRLQVDDAGYTRPETGAPNVQVCLHSDSEKFFDFYMTRVLEH